MKSFKKHPVGAEVKMGLTALLSEPSFDPAQ